MMDAERNLFIQKSNAGSGAERPGYLWWLLIVMIFLVGMAVRLYDLSDPPLDFHSTRQLHSALIARGMYYQQRADLPAWQREMAVQQWQLEGVIEPPIFEHVTAWAYGLVGSADLRIPRLIAIFAWLLGAVFLVWTAVDLVGLGGALVAAWFFLAWPYGVIASRAFQPEPILVALMIITIWSALRWNRNGSWKWAAVTGILAGLTIYFKTVAIFFVAPALICLALSKNILRQLRSPQVWVVAVLALVPSAAYYIDGVFIRGYLISQFSERFFPQLWIDPAFYLRWIGNLGRVLPLEMTLAALLGAVLARRPLFRMLFLSQWVGYFIYGMALPHHISTHDYYHLLLFPQLALGLGQVGEVIFRNLRGPGWFVRGFATAVLAAALVINGYNARTAMKKFDGLAQARMWEEIGGLLGHGASVAALVPDYGSGLKYWGWINPSLWLTEDEIIWRQSIGQTVDFQTWFEQQAAGKDYFVVTIFDEFDLQPQLKTLLSNKYPLIKQTQTYLIFDLRAAKQK